MPTIPLLRPKPGTKADRDLLAEIEHGRENLQRTAPGRDEAWNFYRGNHFAYLNERGALSFLPDGQLGVRKAGKSANRARQKRNFIFDVVRRERSHAVSRVPSFQVVPSTTDPQDVGAARLSEKLLIYGYAKWQMRRAIKDAVTHAIVGGEAFGWVYFDNTIGPFVGEGEDAIGTGDVRIRVYGGNECFWVPGLRFHESPWHCVEQAVAPDQVKAMPGYLGGELTPDADSRSNAGRRSDKGKLVMVTHWLERPCPKYPEGRWKVFANKREICEERPYPGDGQEPVLRPLAYAADPDNDRDLGLVPQLLDAQRTKNDSENKAVEWKNHCLYPQMVAAPGVFKKQRRDDTPGRVYEFPNPNENVKVLDVPAIPDSLYTMGDRAENDLFKIAAQADPPSGAESGKAFQAWDEKNQAASSDFLASLAEWLSGIGHDGLVEAQENYSEPRLITIRGDFGWESIPDFKGAMLRDQVDVRVFPDSIEPQTRAAKEQKIMNFAQMGAIDPVSAMTAIETGATEGLIRSYAQDEARAGRIIQRIKDGSIAQMPMLPTGRMEQIPDPTGQVDPYTMEPVMVDTDEPQMAPAWMPRMSDNLGLFKTIFSDFMKTEEFERSAQNPVEFPDGPQTVAWVAATIYAGILQLENEQAAQAMAAQNAQAEQLGMNNAARPQGAKPNPSLPSVNGNQ